MYQKDWLLHNPKFSFCRFSINYFTAIGLGYLTEELREWLKTAPPPAPTLLGLGDSSSDSSDSDSSSSSSSSSSGSTP